MTTRRSSTLNSAGKWGKQMIVRTITALGTMLVLSTGANAQTLGPSDLRGVTETYKQNEARFKRDYSGRKFSGTVEIS